MLFSRTKSAADAVGNLGKGEWADVKVKIVGRRARRQDRRLPRQGRGADAATCRAVRLFHTSVAARHRHLADLARRARLHRRLRRVPRADVPDVDGRRLRGPRGRRRQRGDLRRAGPVLVDRPHADAPVRRQDLQARPAAGRHTRRPTSSSTSSSGSCQPTLPDGAAEPRLRRRRPQRRRRTAGSPRARRSSATAYAEADDDLTLARDARRRRTRRRSSRPTTASRRSSWRSTPASRWSTSGLLSRPQTSNCRPRHGRDHRQGQGLLGRRRAPDLPQRRGPRPGRGGALPAGRGGRRRRPTVRQIKRRLPRPHRPQRLEPRRHSPRAGRSSTGPSPRPSPATSRTARARPPTWPTRPGPATSSSSPTRRTSSTPRRPGTLIAPSHFFGQHGYVPDVQDLADNINMRATFLAGGKGIAKGTVTRAHDRPRADARVPARHPRAAAQPGPRPARDRQGRQRLQADLDHRPQRLPRAARPDDAAHDRRHQRHRRRRRRSSRRCSTRSSRALPGPGAASSPAGDNVGASPPNSALLEDMPAIDVENAWGLDATSLRQPRVRLRRRAAARPASRGRTSRSSPRTSSRPRPARLPPWVDAVGGVHRQRHQGRRHRRRAREHARARLRRRDRGPDVPRRGAADQGRVRAAASALGVKVQVVVIHQGTNDGHEPHRQRRAACRGTARSSTSPTSSRTRRSTRWSSATPTASRT